MVKCYIALGSNLERPLTQVQTAVDALGILPNTTLLQVSRWYQTKAIGPGEQPDYINGVACINTKLEPFDLLKSLQQIENSQRRVRKERWGPRTLDLDILLYAEQIINTPTLQIPHPRMNERNFVLYPLFDIAPQLQFPDGTLLQTLIDKQPNNNIQRLDETHGNSVA